MKLYYVLKLGDLYYAPYRSLKAFGDDNILETFIVQKKLASRFGTKKMAKFILSAFSDKDFSNQLRIVKVVYKKRCSCTKNCCSSPKISEEKIRIGLFVSKCTNCGKVCKCEW
jgi:hypothetical protein